jgi:hypothetical protein
MISMKTILWAGMRGDEGLKKVREKRESQREAVHNIPIGLI